MYSIVEFINDGSVQAVPSEWVVGLTSCLWPKVSFHKVTKMTQSNALPEENWESHKIRILGRAVTLVDAQKKAKRAEMTSDLDSTDHGKRTRRPCEKFFLYDDDNNEQLNSKSKKSRHSSSDDSDNSSVHLTSLKNRCSLPPIPSFPTFAPTRHKLADYEILSKAVIFPSNTLTNHNEASDNGSCNKSMSDPLPVNVQRSDFWSENSSNDENSGNISSWRPTKQTSCVCGNTSLHSKLFLKCINLAFYIHFKINAIILLL